MCAYCSSVAASMKISLLWLQDYFAEKLKAKALAEQLTLAGLEVDAVCPVAKENLAHVVVGQVVSIEQHSNADRLRVCQIKVNNDVAIPVVTNAPEVTVGMKVVVALEGAELANGIEIKSTEMRGIVSKGMLCSSVELGLEEAADEIMQLPEDAPIGQAIENYLQLNDAILEINVTPNRGDCLSVQGMAREVAAILNYPSKSAEITKAAVRIKAQRDINVADASDCPHYVGRIIQNVNAEAETPLWIKERLRRSGIRSICALVDIGNYVMLEMGQALHIFDNDKLQGAITIRRAKTGEKLTLLDNKEVQLSPEILVIADEQKAHAMAGIMGGLESAVTADTKNIFIESAYFDPRVINGRARRYGLQTDAATRFERGVSPAVQTLAMEHVTELLQSIVGGEVGPLCEYQAKDFPAQKASILLRKQRIEQLLGYSIADSEIESILKRLGMALERHDKAWQVQAPVWRFDITQEIDLIEEIARIYGYQQIPTLAPPAELRFSQADEAQVDLNTLRHLLQARDYTEAITYSFVEPQLQNLLDPEVRPLPLKNPISEDLSVMRSNLWPGLISVAIYNLSRQQQRIRLFETGLRFIQQGADIKQEAVIAGLSIGPLYPEQWAIPSKKVDFYDMKADVEGLLALTGHGQDFQFIKNESHPALHPGQSCQICLDGETIGYLGQLHPQVQVALDLDQALYVFELRLADILKRVIPQYKGWSKFPLIRRDIALMVGQAVTAEQIRATVMAAGTEWLRDVFIFDVYQGKGITPGKKSLALGLILQHSSRTLMDSEINEWVEKLVGILKQTYNATLRE